MSSLSEKTTVPIGWFVAGFGSTILATFVATIWIYSVNVRLQRIESKLGISEPVAGITIPLGIPAEAKEFNRAVAQ